MSLDSTCSSDGSVTIDAFGRTCTCINNKNSNCCRYRQDWSSLSLAQKQRYISAILTVSSSSSLKPLYEELLEKYRSSFDTLAQSTNPETSQFIPWHRYFLMEYEDLLRLVHKDITIPYWDWTSSNHDPYSNPVFDPDFGFGNSADPVTGCITSGPLRKGEFNISLFSSSPYNSSSSFSEVCLTRHYENFIYPGTDVLRELLSLDSGLFTVFHNSIQLFLDLNVRCFIGGHMCTSDAANDPLFFLHLARLDLFVQQWQDQNPNNNITRSEGHPSALLMHTLDGTLLTSNFSRTTDLAYGACVRYAPPLASGEITEDSAAMLGLSFPPSEGGEETTRVSFASLCLPDNRVELRGLVLSEQIQKFLSSICGLM